MKWKTNITEMIGCEYPIILGAFAGFDNSQLTASISKAGGFGVLTGSYFTKEENLRNAINEIKNITNNPFGINLSPNNPPDFRKDLYELFGNQFEIAREEKIKTIITVGPKVEIIGRKIKDYGIKPDIDYDNLGSNIGMFLYPKFQREINGHLDDILRSDEPQLREISRKIRDRSLRRFCDAVR